MSDEATDTETKTTKETKVKAEKIEQNGVVRPRNGTDCHAVWAAFEGLSDKLGRPATRDEVQKDPSMESINPATFATQYARAVKFHNVSSRLKQHREESRQAARKGAAEKAEEAKRQKAIDEKAKVAAAKEKEEEKQRKADEKAAAAEAKKADKAAAKAAA